MLGTYIERKAIDDLSKQIENDQCPDGLVRVIEDFGVKLLKIFLRGADGQIDESNKQALARSKFADLYESILKHINLGVDLPADFPNNLIYGTIIKPGRKQTSDFGIIVSEDCDETSIQNWISEQIQADIEFGQGRMEFDGPIYVTVFRLNSDIKAILNPN